MRRVLVVSLWLALFWTALPAGQAHARAFRLFDAMLFAGRPDTTKLGFQKLRIVDDHELWPPNGPSNDPPATAEIRKIVAAGVGPSGLLVIDIEHWNMLSMATRDNAREKFIQTLDRFHEAAPGLKVGLYEILPSRNYWTALGQNGANGYRSWQADNNFAAPIVAHVDALFPSLYTFYPNEAGWVKYATENLREARRISHGKPIYCFLWPQYHGNFLMVPGDYWRAELDTCHRLADGIVIWGGYTMTNGFAALPWRDDAPWWQATLEFVKTLDR